MVNGPIRVTRSDGEIDTTENAHGAVLPNFVRNTIERPGLCLARNTESAPNSCAGFDCGYFDNGFNVQGTLFTGASQALRFGNLTANVGANNVAGWTNTAVDATVPNLSVGNNTMYVEIDNEISNYLNFGIKFDTDNQPVIDYISPASGPIEQYVTIFGSGFQEYLSGTSLVQFINTSFGTFNADGLDFPIECRDRWWNNTYITVKVPAGIGANIGAYDVVITNRSANVSEPESFNVTAGDPGPGICLLDPANGPINQAVDVYGDNFENTQGSGFVRFYNNVSATVYSGWTNQLASTAVPSGASSGPLQLSSAAGISNSLPFMVGYCSDDAQCNGSEECCGSGTYWSGICRPTGDCSVGGPTMTGYGWTFTTSDGPPPDPVVCGGYSNNAACISADTCPNSLGECATRSGVVMGDCDNANCNSAYPLCSGACVYDAATNLCQANGLPLQTTCDQISTTVVTGYTSECREVPGQYSGDNVWQINSTSCPTGTFPDTNGWCTVGVPGTPNVCSTCSFGFTCISGDCYISNAVCPAGSTCNGAGECIKDTDVCECCCRVGYGGTDCCYGLTCTAGDCGNDPLNYGLCTGCRVELNSNPNDLSTDEQLASDLACNCTGTFGKYCEVANPADPNDTGACIDAKPCDSNVNTSTCDPENTMCDVGEFCGTDCFCKKAKPCDDNNNVADGCSLTTNCDAATEYCDDTDCFCKPIPPCDGDDNLSNGCSRDNTKCPANMYCGVDCYCSLGESCDVD
ncbi:MAG: IPT/TIG domain-containing protein, partial [Candidatus Saccharibacteria bacterium]|nr:IPT/TIG domain-containing protein [Candidatus Saccharibacteria bacterium]